MRKLIASTFTSLDGVMQAPGGPTEDPTGNFTLGGWLFAFGDDAGMDLSAAGFDGKDRELVLGRKTYEIFEAYWPYQSEDDPIARTLNAAKKHVASRTLKSFQWNNSSVLGGDIVSYPVVLGRGKRLFENGARPCALRLVASKVSTTGVVMSTYVPAGDIPLGSLSQAEPSAKELTRRAKMATDAT